jgi:heme o synthase
LFLIVFLWTPPHFWSLSLNRTEEYARAGVPMLPAVAGRTATTRQILIYSFVLMPVSMLPWALGFAGTIYGAAAAVCSGVLIVLALQLGRSSEVDRRAAHRLFSFSVVYLFVIFATLLASNGGSRWSHRHSAQAAPLNDGSMDVEPRPRLVRAARNTTGLRAEEA